ncbi:MAG TPA: DUF1501 domain-containing protein [Solirubrobacteraceae bacterium]|jgi:uncharacterized protein (DUF1501 family)|nr:DUF1501 domain-containing protein [Solirubrobacteraceae bacterium]
MARSCSCNDFNRAALLRRGAAVAGKGLPKIEPGMPMPAGTGLDRRTFLLASAGAALSVYGASMLSPRHFEAGIAEAAASGSNQPVLVSIFMEGGWDALSVLAPAGAVGEEGKTYETLRPKLSLEAKEALEKGTGKTFTEDPRLMWHPSATGLAELHEEGKVTAFPAIGYEPQDESHFTSRHYWEVGQLDTNTRTGWLGRFLDLPGVGEPNNPLQGLSLDYSLAPALATETMPVAAVSSPADYTMWAEGLGSPVIEPALETFGALGALGAPSPAYAQARGASYDTDLVLDKMASFVKSEKESGDKSAVTYPAGEFAQRLAVLAAMLHTEMPIKCASLNAVGSYDTHSNEAGTLAANLAQTVAAVLAFQRDLEARGLDQRVLIQLWSEFGRRPRENGSGTDHGAGGNAFLIGTRASGKMVGEFSGLTNLDENENIVRTSDFRAMYCSLLEQWFHTEAGLVIPEAASFERPTLIKA